MTDKQVFLPFIGTMLMDEKEPLKRIEKFVYSTQQLFLFYLYGKKKRLYSSEAGKVLPFTAMTLTRAVKQLEATDLFYVTKDGVNKFIESKYDRYELFEKAKVYLSTPVRRAGYIDKTQISNADDFSVILSFGDTNDERIEEAVDELQERRLKE